MGKINIDMGGEDYSTKGASVPAGYYQAKVLAVTVKSSKNMDENTNKPAVYFEWQVQLLSGPAAGTKMVARTTAIKGKRWLLKQALACCGIAETDGKFNFDLEDLNGKMLTVKVEVKTEEFVSKVDGKKRMSEKSVINAFLKEVPAEKTEDVQF